MMTELSLNILDIVQNSIRASASFIEIIIMADLPNDLLFILIQDNGCGMSKEQLKRITDPFYTTRTTRRIGLGIPLYKYAAESSGGHFNVYSEPGKGTIVSAFFGLTHINRMPLGDITATIHTLITVNNQVDFLYTYMVDLRHFTLDTREFRKILGDISLSTPEVSTYIREFLIKHKQDIDSGKIL